MALRRKTCLALITASSLAPSVAQVVLAQSISIDGRFSPAQTLSAVGGSYAIGANLGKQVGSNLFHSFGKFGLATGESATFSGPAAVSNVIGRVTGGTQSNIDGKIASTINGANLYLINPSGIVFGPNATVDVKGSFHASTADYVKMSDGAKFQATNPDASTLTAAPPVAFGFLTSRPAALTVNGSTFGVPQGQTVGLVGGPMAITNNAAVAAPAGTIHVASAAGIGEVAVHPRNAAASTVTSFGPVDIKGNSTTLNVSDRVNLGSGGSVFIRAGALTIDASEVNADNYGSGPGGVLSLRGDNQITLSNGGNVHAVAMSSGSGADVLLSTAPTGSILADAAMLMTDTFGRGSGGSISIVAGQLALHNLTNVLAQSHGSGFGGDAVISVGGSLTIDTGASLGTFARGTGSAGGVSVTVAGPVAIDMSVGAVPSTFQGIGSATRGSGSAGNVTVTAGTLFLLNNGEIVSSTFAPGNAGNVSISSSDRVTIDGLGADRRAAPTGILSRARSGSRGSAGTVSVTAGTLSIVGSGEISTSTFGFGNAGANKVVVSDQLAIDGSRADPSVPTGIFSQTNMGSSGSAGAVSVTARTLSILNNGVIASSTSSSGNAGSTAVVVSGQLSINASGADPSAGATGIFSQANLGSTGTAGNVSVTAGTLSISASGEISSSTLGIGNAGDVTVNALGRLTIDGSGENLMAGITAIASQGNPESSGNAGTVTVSAASLVMGNDGRISSGQLGSGHGGEIRLRVSDFLYLLRSEITTSVIGETGNGGNIVIDPQLVILDHSRIIAQAIEGHGGNITITADQFIPSSDSVISATSQEGVSGTVLINGLVNANGAVAVLSTQFRARAEVLREACESRTLSSLIEAGRGGLPPNPEATLPALYIAGRDLNPNSPKVADTAEPRQTLHTTVRLTMRCN